MSTTNSPLWSTLRQVAWIVGIGVVLGTVLFGVYVGAGLFGI